MAVSTQGSLYNEAPQLALPEAVLIVPAFDEANRLAGEPYKRALHTYAEAFSNAYTHSSDYLLLVVDNGSPTSETGEIAKEHGFDLLQSPVKGKGAAIRYGIVAVMNSLDRPNPADMHIAFTDADGAYQPHTIMSLIEHTMGDADIAVARRVSTPESTKERIDRRIAHVAIQKAFQRYLPTGVSDPNAGAVAMSGDAIAEWEASMTDGFTTPAEILHKANKKGLRIREVDAVVTNAAESRVHPVRDGIQLVRDIRHIRQATRPAA